MADVNTQDAKPQPAHETFVECKPWTRDRTIWSRGFAWLNGEVLLKIWPNCGTVIAFRALWSTVVICAAALAISNAIDPNRLWQFNRRELQLELLAGLPWFATALAATYAALYARFASQWSYVAELYNSIKTAECTVSTEEHRRALAEWKAGFLEDCEELHLARKAGLATTIHIWGNEPAVQDAFIKHALGGKNRLVALLCVVSVVTGRERVAMQSNLQAPQ